MAEYLIPDVGIISDSESGDEFLAPGAIVNEQVAAAPVTPLLPAYLPTMQHCLRTPIQ